MSIVQANFKDVLRIQYDIGEDDQGNTKTSWRTDSNINHAVTDQTLYTYGGMLAGLCKDSAMEVGRQIQYAMREG